MASISGIRGVIGESLTPETVVRYASAFGRYVLRRNPSSPSVILGRDGRVTGPAVASLVRGTLSAAGVRVRDIGVCPTPTVQIAVERGGADGGIAVTASHNPMQWNGLKFMAGSGMFLDAAENRELFALAEEKGVYVPWESVGPVAEEPFWIDRHIEAVLGLPVMAPGRIRERRFRVVLDCVNAAGGVIVPPLLEKLGCTVIPLNCDVSGVFAHTPEPVPENLTALAAAVRSAGADIGIAVDPDVDRLVLITERGEPYGEEYTVASAVEFILGRMGKEAAGARVVVNLSTTRAVDDIAGAHGALVVRTPVGEINVAKKMKEIGAAIGGEGSGGVILPDVHLGRDAIVGIGLLLQLLAESGGTLSALKERLPLYRIAKGKMEIAGMSPDEVLARIARAHEQDGRLTRDDGLKIDFPGEWVHLRKSNTEPIIRIIAEAKEMERARAVVEAFRREITGDAGPA
ncbi:MAG TPA: phosphoglucosamine mutase [Bacteroidota bacterium]|nr:phosphoglucosamine mutase [Bacteroidota bacterium]